MDIERDLRAHLLERTGGPIPADLTARLAARIEPRGPRSRRTVGLPVAAAVAGLAAVLVVAIVLATLAVPGPSASSPTLATSVASGPTATPSATGSAPASIGASPSPKLTAPSSSGFLPHPTGTIDVILSLRYESNGGIPTTDALRLLRPGVAFALYGDGTAVYQRSRTILGSLLLGPRAFQKYTSKLDPAQVDHLLHFALDASHLRDAGGRYIDNVVPRDDAILSVDADGVDRSLTVSPGLDPTTLPPAEARTAKALQGLVQYLATFETSAAAKAAGGTSIYRAAAYLAVLDLDPVGSIPKDIGSSPWPWLEVPLSAFGPAAASTRTALVTPAEYDALLTLHTWYGEGIVVRGPDGRRYVLSARPLLPGETAP